MTICIDSFDQHWTELLKCLNFTCIKKNDSESSLLSLSLQNTSVFSIGPALFDGALFLGSW